MKNHFIFFALVSLTFSISSCVNDEPNPIEPELDYSFFVAGHTYGKNGVDNAGLHPAFEAYYDSLNTYPSMFLGVLTGDIVITSNNQQWNDVDASINRLNMPIHFAIGNHDIQSDSTLVESRYGATYKAFTNNNDLFIILNTNLDSLNISGVQLDFLNHTLDSLGQQADNIFVFLHHMIWWEEDNIFELAPPNSIAQRGETVNYWTEIEPIFNALDKPVFLFSGDAGANHVARSLTYYNAGDITYITSGMGFEQKDNIIIAEVMDNKEVRLKVIGLNCNEGYDCMGNIEDYLPF